MDTNSIHPLTEALADILIEAVKNHIDESGISREVVIFAMGEFLQEYEERSLISAFATLMGRLRALREMTEPYLELSYDDLLYIPQERKDEMSSQIQIAVAHSLIMNAVIDLVEPLSNR